LDAFGGERPRKETVLVALASRSKSALNSRSASQNGLFAVVYPAGVVHLCDGALPAGLRDDDLSGKLSSRGSFG